MTTETATSSRQSILNNKKITRKYKFSQFIMLWKADVEWRCFTELNTQLQKSSSQPRNQHNWHSWVLFISMPLGIFSNTNHLGSQAAFTPEHIRCFTGDLAHTPRINTFLKQQMHLLAHAQTFPPGNPFHAPLFLSYNSSSSFGSQRNVTPTL